MAFLFFVPGLLPGSRCPELFSLCVKSLVKWKDRPYCWGCKRVKYLNMGIYRFYLFRYFCTRENSDFIIYVKGIQPILSVLELGVCVCGGRREVRCFGSCAG